MWPHYIFSRREKGNTTEAAGRPRPDRLRRIQPTTLHHAALTNPVSKTVRDTSQRMLVLCIKRVVGPPAKRTRNEGARIEFPGRLKSSVGKKFMVPSPSIPRILSESHDPITETVAKNTSTMVMIRVRALAHRLPRRQIRSLML